MNLRGPVSSGTLERITKKRLDTRCNNVCSMPNGQNGPKQKWIKLCVKPKTFKFFPIFKKNKKKKPGDSPGFFRVPGSKKNTNFGGQTFPKEKKDVLKVPFPEADPKQTLTGGSPHPCWLKVASTRGVVSTKDAEINHLSFLKISAWQQLPVDSVG